MENRIGSVRIHSIQDGVKVVLVKDVERLLFGDYIEKCDPSLRRNAISNWINSLDERVILQS